MKVEKIENYEDLCESRLISQYKRSPIIVKIARIIGLIAQDVEDSLYPLYNRLDIRLSEGIWLDKIGEILGEDRNGLSDEKYRIRLLARIFINISNGETESIITVFKILTQSRLVYLEEVFPAELSLVASTLIPDEDALENHKVEAN